MRTMPRTVGQPAPLLQPLTFATEDGAHYTPPGETTPPRANPIPYAQPAPPPLPALEQSSTHSVLQMPQQQAPAPAPAPAPFPQAQPVQQQQQPPPVEAPPSVAPPAPAPAGAADQNDAMVQSAVEQIAPLLAQQFDQRIQPQEVASQIIATNGIELTRTALGIVTIDQLLRIITTNPAYPALATRNGQKFLREIWKHAEQAVAQ